MHNVKRVQARYPLFCRATPSYTVQREWTANDQNKPIATQGKPEPTTVDDDADLLNDDFDMEGLDEM